MEKFAKQFSEWGMDTSQQATFEDVAQEESRGPKPVLPCLIAMCGSGAECLRVRTLLFI